MPRNSWIEFTAGVRIEAPTPQTRDDGTTDAYITLQRSGAGWRLVDFRLGPPLPA